MNDVYAGRLIELMEQIAVDHGRIASNTEMIAIGLSKLTDRCFCGDRLDEHFGEDDVVPTQCRAEACKCEAFLPIHLSIARVLNILGIEMQGFTALIAAVTGATKSDAGPRIVTPFTN